MNAKRPNPFYVSPAWRAIRRVVLIRDGFACTQCGASVAGRGLARVDHIIPLRRAWHLRLSESNLRTLCATCDNRRHSEKRRGVETFGADARGQPIDPAHWWNK